MQPSTGGDDSEDMLQLRDASEGSSCVQHNSAAVPRTPNFASEAVKSCFAPC
jgi:hypothetical protein